MMRIEYAVVVGNVGTVHTGTDQRTALLCYQTYCDQSESGRGLCGGEDVVLFADDEPSLEFVGSLASANEREER